MALPPPHDPPAGSSGDPPDMDDLFPGEMPLFALGDLVMHRKYGYRGVVVDYDLTCQADEAWYRNNRTQPNRDQPWYHVLVDGSTAVTYAAQANLLADPSEQPVHHPVVPRFFDQFLGSRYERNETAWPGWDAIHKDDDEDRGEG